MVAAWNSDYKDASSNLLSVLPVLHYFKSKGCWFQSTKQQIYKILSTQIRNCPTPSSSLSWVYSCPTMATNVCKAHLIYIYDTNFGYLYLFLPTSLPYVISINSLLVSSKSLLIFINSLLISRSSPSTSNITFNGSLFSPCG